MGMLSTSTIIFQQGHGFEFEFDGENIGYVKRGIWTKYQFLGFVVNEITLLVDDLGKSLTFVNIVTEHPSSLLCGPKVNIFKEGKIIRERLNF